MLLDVDLVSRSTLPVYLSRLICWIEYDLLNGTDLVCVAFFFLLLVEMRVRRGCS